MVIESVLLNYRLEEVPIPTRYTEESSSVSIVNLIIYILRTFETLLKYKINTKKIQKKHEIRLLN